MRHARAHRGKYVAAILLLALLLALSGVVLTSRPISRRSALDTVPAGRSVGAPGRKSIAVPGVVPLLRRAGLRP